MSILSVSPCSAVSCYHRCRRIGLARVTVPNSLVIEQIVGFAAENISAAAQVQKRVPEVRVDGKWLFNSVCYLVAVPLDRAEKLRHFFLLIQKHGVFEITSVSSRPAKYMKMLFTTMFFNLEHVGCITKLFSFAMLSYSS